MFHSESEPHELEEKLQILVDASATLLGSLNLEDILPAVLHLTRKLNAPDACAIWRFDCETSTWRIAAALGLSEAFQKAAGPEMATEGGAERPISFENVDEAPLAADRREVYAAEKIRSLLAAPMKMHANSPRTLTLYYRERRRFSTGEVRAASALASLASAAIETSELYRENERSRIQTEKARRHSAFLAEASAVLASSLDYETTLATVATLAVPHIADWCAVDIVQHDGGLKQVALAHTDAEKVERAKELNRRYPPASNAVTGPPAVVRTGKAELRSEIPDRLLRMAARDAEHLALLRAIGFQSYMCMPLTARGRVLGAITFVSAQATRLYTEEDLALAQDLARRAAIAVDHALLYARAQRERTALEAALGALRENEARLMMALGAASMSIWDWDIAANEIGWTGNMPAALDLSEDASGATFEAFLSVIRPDDRAAFQASLDRAIQQKTGFECEFRTIDRHAAKWIACEGRAYYSDTGQAVRVIGLAADVTGRRGLEEKLRTSQKFESIGLLAGGVAHDFNNLLTGIMGNASLALDLGGADDTTTPLLENVLRATERAADLTRQLLAYSGKGRFIIQPIELSGLVSEIANLAQAAIPKMVAITLELDQDLPYIEADSNQLQQVIMNLVINAAEAIGNQTGTILVKTGLQSADEDEVRQFAPEELDPGDYAYLEVVDTGCGMDAETQAKIFDPFFTTKFTGRGLGLAAASGIVRSHRGAIRVSSAPGKGSTFRVLFPIVQPDSFPAGSRSGAAPGLQGSGLILVIDDEEMVEAAADAALSRYGYRVEVARNGPDGVALFEERPDEFASVLIDLTMPALGGEGALRAIKRIRPDIPVIASTGYAETEAQRRFPPGVLAAFLKKPYSSAELARKLKKVLPKPLVHRQTNG